ncbi:MAG: Clp protease N-terminal domain-containing protein, partial [Deltaproteobacteria bacterium]|nr:Clp protease N-terminal domain-containing protein [Deltaproteobacteria bacterium]
MRFDKFTLKAQEALQDAQAVTEKREHQQIEPEHLLIALLQQNEGIVPQVFQKLGASIPNTLSQLDEALGKIPKVYGSGMGQGYLSPRLQKILDGSFRESDRLK